MQKNSLIDHIFLRDSNDRDNFYQPIAVIAHKGAISSDGSTRGHFTCDIRKKGTNEWCRTSDDRKPMTISSSDVSKNGYVFLYERC